MLPPHFIVWFEWKQSWAHSGCSVWSRIGSNSATTVTFVKIWKGLITEEVTKQLRMWGCDWDSTVISTKTSATQSSCWDKIVHQKSRLVSDFHCISPQRMYPCFYLFLSFFFHQFVCRVVIHPPPSTLLVFKQLRHELACVCIVCASRVCVLYPLICVCLCVQSGKIRFAFIENQGRQQDQPWCTHTIRHFN